MALMDYLTRMRAESGDIFVLTTTLGRCFDTTVVAENSESVLYRARRRNRKTDLHVRTVMAFEARGYEELFSHVL